MGKLPACKPSNKYRMLFWTVEASPEMSKEAAKEELLRCATSFAPTHVMCGYEIGESGYRHLHLVTMWEQPQRWRAMQKMIQKRMWFKKENGAGISVRAFHPRPGTEKRSDMKSYLTDKKYKVTMGDNELTIMDANPYDVCMCSVRLGKWYRNKSTGWRPWCRTCNLHCPYGGDRERAIARRDQWARCEGPFAHLKEARALA